MIVILRKYELCTLLKSSFREFYTHKGEESRIYRRADNTGPDDDTWAEEKYEFQKFLLIIAAYYWLLSQQQRRQRLSSRREFNFFLKFLTSLSCLRIVVFFIIDQFISIITSSSLDENDDRSQKKNIKKRGEKMKIKRKNEYERERNDLQWVVAQLELFFSVYDPHRFTAF